MWPCPRGPSTLRCPTSRSGRAPPGAWRCTPTARRCMRPNQLAPRGVRVGSCEQQQRRAAFHVDVLCFVSVHANSNNAGPPFTLMYSCFASFHANEQQRLGRPSRLCTYPLSSRLCLNVCTRVDASKDSSVERCLAVPFFATTPTINHQPSTTQRQHQHHASGGLRGQSGKHSRLRPDRDGASPLAGETGTISRVGHPLRSLHTPSRGGWPRGENFTPLGPLYWGRSVGAACDDISCPRFFAHELVRFSRDGQPDLTASKP